MWIKSDYDFGYPYKNFTVGVRELQAANQIKGYLVDFQNEPDKIEQLVQAVVEFYRPSLKGGTVCGIVLRGGMIFEIAYTHPSLPRIKMTTVPESESLIPDEDGMKRAGEIFIKEDEV